MNEWQKMAPILFFLVRLVSTNKFQCTEGSLCSTVGMQQSSPVAMEYVLVLMSMDRTKHAYVSNSQYLLCMMTFLFQLFFSFVIGLSFTTLGLASCCGSSILLQVLFFPPLAGNGAVKIKSCKRY